MMAGADMRLELRRRIAASPERLYSAWTTPEQLLAWWGPRGVRCIQAEVELHVGGRYRLGNQLPDGRVLFIVGEFLAIEPPNRLVYTWSIEAEVAQAELVTVSFNQHGAETEVVVVHERIRDRATRDEHVAGWNGCLDGLAAHVLPKVERFRSCLVTVAAQILSHRRLRETSCPLGI